VHAFPPLYRSDLFLRDQLGSAFGVFFWDKLLVSPRPVPHVPLSSLFFFSASGHKNLNTPSCGLFSLGDSSERKSSVNSTSSPFCYSPPLADPTCLPGMVIKLPNPQADPQKVSRSVNTPTRRRPQPDGLITIAASFFLNFALYSGQKRLQSSDH